MSKHFLEDMVLEKRARKGVGSIKDAKKVIRKTPEVEDVQEVRKITETDLSYLKTKKKPDVTEMGEIREITETDINFTKKNSRYLLWIVALVSAIFCFFAVSFLFAKAEVSVNPKIQNVVLNENLSASKDSSGGGLAFNLVVIPGQQD